MTEKFWSYRTTSKETGMPVGTLYALVSKKRIPHIRLGRRHVLFPVEELLAWLAKHRVA